MNKKIYSRPSRLPEVGDEVIICGPDGYSSWEDERLAKVISITGRTMMIRRPDQLPTSYIRELAGSSWPNYYWHIVPLTEDYQRDQEADEGADLL